MPWAVGDLAGAAIEVEEALVEMADLDRVEAIDLLEQPLADRSAEEEKWMRRKTKNRLTAARAELAQVGESAQIFDFVRPDIQEDHVRSLQPHLGGLDEQNSHGGSVGENLRSIENLVVQRNGERAETELARPLQQLMGGVIETIFRIVERVDMQIDLDPILVLLLVIVIVLAPAALLHLRHDRCSFCALLVTSLGSEAVNRSSIKSTITSRSTRVDKKQEGRGSRFLLSCVPDSRFWARARVVKWQTRTFEGRMPQGMGVQVPPRALPSSSCSCS